MDNINLSDFHFLRPWFLLLFPVVAFILYKWLRNKTNKDGWHQSCDPHLLEAMQLNSAAKASPWISLYWPIALLAILALSGPALRKTPIPLIKNQSALIIALDVSKSMLSDDLKPSRLQRAKFKIQDLLNQREDGQTALVVYSGDAFVVTPLTDDVETIIALLDALDPSIMPIDGTNTLSALNKAEQLLNQAGINNGRILMVTDGININKTRSRLEQLKSKNIKTSILAIGTEQGAPIPTSQGFLKDLAGRIVIPKLDLQELNQAAKAGGGSFSIISAGNSDISEVVATTDSLDDINNADERQTENYIDEGPFVALMILPLMALLYRRGILMVLFIGFNLNPQTSMALDWNDLWLNKDQQAWENLNNSEPDKAFATAENQKIKAAAAYQQQEYKQAAQLYAEKGDSLDDHYNQGNALAQSGELELALESYDKALTYNPEDEDTLYNKKIVEEALKQQQQQEQQQQDQENQDQDQQQQDQQSDQSEEQSEGEKQQENQQQQEQAEKDQEQNPEGQQAEQEQQAQEQEGEEQEIQEVELTPEEKALDAEEKQAMEQWLRRIKDDPGGLLRRKFLYQYHRRNQNGETYNKQQITEDW